MTPPFPRRHEIPVPVASITVFEARRSDDRNRTIPSRTRTTVLPATSFGATELVLSRLIPVTASRTTTFVTFEPEVPKTPIPVSNPRMVPLRIVTPVRPETSIPTLPAILVPWSVRPSKSIVIESAPATRPDGQPLNDEVRVTLSVITSPHAGTAAFAMAGERVAPATRHANESKALFGIRHLLGLRRAGLRIVSAVGVAGNWQFGQPSRGLSPQPLAKVLRSGHAPLAFGH
jgi:hypothetical protein